MKKSKVIIVMPAYYAANTLEKTLVDIPKKLVSEIILVDDASKDFTVQVAQKLRLTVYQHPHNLGYGGNQKTCYWEALKRKPDIIVMLHPDYQYDGSLLYELIKPIIDNKFDIMLGSRIQTRQQVLSGGMPFYKYISNRFLTILENIILGENLSEWHSGFRAYKREVLENVPFQRFSNDFIFDQEILISAISFKFKIGTIFVPCRYFPEASSITLKKSVVYGLGILKLLGMYLLHQRGVKSKLFQP